MIASPGLFTKHGWSAGTGDFFVSINPASGDTVWGGHSASASQVDRAIQSAADVQPNWSRTSWEVRLSACQRFAEQLQQMQATLADAISRETGKPRWEAKTEVASMIGKVAISAEAFADRCRGLEIEQGGITSAMRFRPHGVVAVLGPFNFPGHLPNGHIIPALLAGNTVVFKPSELAPLVAELTVYAWERAGLPAGVLNLVQGGREVGEAVAGHPRLDGLLFTGSAATGLALSRQFANTPGKILALEMGGNNPLIAWDVADPAAAAVCIIQSAFITAGQRCSCARRLVVPDDARGKAIVSALVAQMHSVRVGLPADDPEPFIGPVISASAVEAIFGAQGRLIARGAKPIVPMCRHERSEALLSPGLLEVPIGKGVDQEIFGPLLQVFRVKDFAAALAEANNTRFGLCAGLLSDDQSQWSAFSDAIRAGVIYWNRPTTGGSSRLPFGGLGASGNHRPSAYLAADYCSHAVAVTESPRLTMPINLPPGMGR